MTSVRWTSLEIQSVTKIVSLLKSNISDGKRNFVAAHIRFDDSLFSLYVIRYQQYVNTVFGTRTDNEIIIANTVD